mgnify:CR=1 FL=1
MTDPTLLSDAKLATPAAALEAAQELDANDPLRGFRDQFVFPKRLGVNGDLPRYFVGNSLGLQPKAARDAVRQEMEDWGDLGVDGHFDGRSPWFSYHEQFRPGAAHLLGARESEVVLMNSLTVNLHLLLATFFRPEVPRSGSGSGGRRKILIDWPAFPSDLYVAQTQLAWHGLDPAADLVRIGPRESAGEELIREADVVAEIERRGNELALVMITPVNYLTGQWLDVRPIVEAAHTVGAMIGLDLAHTVGNVPLALHDWGVDFAAFCTYKYLNGGPGAVAGAFVHERHASNLDLTRLGGWWGNDPTTRFRMHLEDQFLPVASADAWQLSNPPILGLAPLRASFALFLEATIERLREKSIRLTGFLQTLLERLAAARGTEGRVSVVTPNDPSRRGAQLSLRITDDLKGRRAALQAAGCVTDFREPDVIRAAPAPLYNSFEDVFHLADHLTRP